MIVSVLEPRGAGALHLRFEELKRKLQDQGLFDVGLKRDLPRYPKSIGIITSSTGAALHDMNSVLQRHQSPVSVFLYPCIVQGEQAPTSIRQALKLAIEHGQVDLLVIGRGGGSYEDLFCFNDEALAREIRASKIPVISAVGHEVDFTIADFVADVRAPTPTAAMELALRSLSELPARISSEHRYLSTAASKQLAQKKQAVSALASRLRNPLSLLEQHRQGFDRLLTQLQKAVLQRLQRRHLDLRELSQRLRANAPSRQFATYEASLNRLKSGLTRQITQHLKNAQMELARQASVLETVSPLSTVARGYAIVFDANEQVVRSVDQVQKGDTIRARVQDGELRLSVTAKSKNQKPN